MLNLNVWNIVFTVVNLLILYALMKKFLVKPVLGIMETRRQLIEGQLADARKNQETARELKVQFEQRMEAAREESGHILEQAREQAGIEQERMIREGKNQSLRLLEKAKRDIADEQESARKESESQIAELAVLAARKILASGESYDTNSH